MSMQLSPLKGLLFERVVQFHALLALGAEDTYNGNLNPTVHILLAGNTMNPKNISKGIAKREIYGIIKTYKVIMIVTSPLRSIAPYSVIICCEYSL